MINWIELNNLNSVDDIKIKSTQRVQVIFKHSTRCSISSVAKNRLEKFNQIEDVDFHYLDLIKHRDVSNYVAETFQVNHESPQILAIYHSECFYEESHYAINMEEIISQINLQKKGL